MSSLNIRKLRLRDYRCFDAIDIDFHPQLTVLIAPNGAGKTSILDAIAVAFGPYIGAFDEATGKHFEASDIRQYRARETSSNEMEYAPKGVRLEASGVVPGYIQNVLVDESAVSTWKRVLSGPKNAKTTIKDAKELIAYGKANQEAVRTPGQEVVLPIIAYYGTGRLWQQKKLTVNKKIHHTSRTIGYTDCLDPASSYKSFVDWFRYWNLNSKDARIKALETEQPFSSTEFDSYIQSVGSAVNICLKKSGWKNIEYSFSLDTLVAYHETYGQLPVELLSDGIRNMIGLVADIAFRATKLNPHFMAQASKLTPGVVLIDEIDMHLHPEWQQVVLQQLVEAFPAIQFIVTTHSPQVLSSVDASSIRILTRGNDYTEDAQHRKVLHVDQQTKGVASADILSEIMGVNPVPDIAESRMLSKYHVLIQQNLHESEDGNKIRSELRSHFGDNHPVLLECDRMIRLQFFKQKLPLSQRES